MIRQIFLLTIILSITTTASAETENRWLGLDGGDETNGKLAIGARYHFDYKDLEDIPVQEEDLSYHIFYEVHNDFAFWQIGSSFTPGPDDDRFDQIITPQLNLIIKDRIYRLGIGAMISSVSINDESDWSSVYWQGIFGFGIPLGPIGIDLMGHYVFESWSKPHEPATDAPEISLTITYDF